MRIVNVAYNETIKDFVFIETQPIVSLMFDPVINFVANPKKKMYTKIKGNKWKAL